VEKTSLKSCCTKLKDAEIRKIWDEANTKDMEFSLKLSGRMWVVDVSYNGKTKGGQFVNFYNAIEYIPYLMDEFIKEETP